MTIDMAFWNQAYGWLCKRKMDPWAAEDLASMACLRMVAAQRRAERGETHIGDWNAYGWVVVRNLLTDYYRCKARYYFESWPEVDDDDYMPEVEAGHVRSLIAALPCAPDPADEVGNADSWQRLLKQAQFTDKQAEVFQMRFVDGCDWCEIAQRMGKEPNAVKALRWRAVGKLRALIVWDEIGD